MSNLREERILRSGSETFTISVPVIAAGEIKYYEPSTDSTMEAMRKYLPLDMVEITNDDVVPVQLIINQVDFFYTAAGSIKKISGRNIWNFSVKNLHATTSTIAGQVRLILQREPITMDSYLRRYRGIRL